MIQKVPGAAAIENRRFYRLPSHSRFVLGNQSKLYSGKAVDISFGGAFIHVLNVEGVQNGDRMRCDFMLYDNSPVLSGIVLVKRVALGSPNPLDYSGIGIEFSDFSGESKRMLEEYIINQKRIYEVLGTLLLNTEPDVRSIRPLLAKLPIQRQMELRDLRVFVETTLLSIQIVEKKAASSGQPPAAPPPPS